VVAQKLASPTFAELANTYMATKSTTATASTFASLEYKISRILLPLLGQLQAHELTHQALEQFVASRKRQGVKNRTIRDDLTYIKAVMNFSVIRSLISSNPTIGYQSPRDDSEHIRPPNKAEFEAMLAHAAPHIQRAMQVCYFTGARPGPIEVYGLRWSAVDWFNQTITIKSAEKGGVETREIPIAPKFMALLQAWIDQDKELEEKTGKRPNYIIHYNGGPVRSIRKGFEMAKTRAGITRRIRRYDLRHMTASELIAAGVDIKTISEILGNTPEQCMRAYLHVRSPQKKSAVDKL